MILNSIKSAFFVFRAETKVLLEKSEAEHHRMPPHLHKKFGSTVG